VTKAPTIKKCVCEGLTYCSHNCRERLVGAQKFICECLSHWSPIYTESWHTPYWEWCVIYYAHESLLRRTRWCLKVLLWGLDSLISYLYRIFTHLVLGLVCDLVRARVTAEKDSVVLRSACVRFELTHLTLICRETWPWHTCIRSSVWFTTRMSHWRERLGGHSAQQYMREGLTRWSHLCIESWHTSC